MNSIDATFLQNNQQRQKEVGAFVSLRYCVMSAIKRTGDHSMNEYWDLLQLAIDCLRDEIRLLEQPSIEVAYLIPNAAGIIPWPSDMLDYIKIGIPINGQLYNLTLNENMLINRAEKCGVDIRTMYKGNSVAITNGYNYIDHFRGSQYISGLYGIGGGFNTAYYKVDYKMRQIQFDGVIPNSEIVLEYNSTGIRGGTIIPAAAIPVIRDYELWQRIENDPRVGANQKDRKKALFDESLAKFHFVINMFSMQEYLDAAYAGTRQGIKR